MKNNFKCLFGSAIPIFLLIGLGLCISYPLDIWVPTVNFMTSCVWLVVISCFSIFFSVIFSECAIKNKETLKKIINIIGTIMLINFSYFIFMGISYLIAVSSSISRLDLSRPESVFLGISVVINFLVFLPVAAGSQPQ